MGVVTPSEARLLERVGLREGSGHDVVGEACSPAVLCSGSAACAKHGQARQLREAGLVTAGHQVHEGHTAGGVQRTAYAPVVAGWNTASMTLSCLTSCSSDQVVTSAGKPAIGISSPGLAL